jgi:hypothetical protein
LGQIRAVHNAVARDIGLHVELWFGRRRTQTLAWVRSAGAAGLVIDDIDLVAELLSDASRRS